MRFPAIQKMIDWFKKLSVKRKILAVALAALFILISPLLYQRVVSFYNSKVCAMNGGEWIPIGSAQTPACIYIYPDGGKPCYSSEECMGGCVIYDPPIQGHPTPSVGICKDTSDPFGCYAPIERPERYWCVD